MVQPKEEEKTKQEPLPTEIQEMLEKYKDIVSDGTPATLPSKRVTSHQIDFSPCSSLPNKVTYKLSPYQNREVVS